MSLKDYLLGYLVAMLGYELGFLRRLKDVLRDPNRERRPDA